MSKSEIERSWARVVKKHSKKKSRDYYSESEIYTSAVKLIGSWFGLKLSLIEKSELKSYISPALDNLDLMKSLNGKDRYGPLDEVVCRFMHDYYGLSHELSQVFTTQRFGSELFTQNTEEFCELLQRKQFRNHNPFAFREDN